MPMVDIIIPAYNSAGFLPFAIDSVIAQTWDDWRIILVNDGSTDNTAEVVAPYIEQLGPKFKYIAQPNAGLPAARNTAIRNSSAELMALLDADDVWLPHRLEESVKCFIGRPGVGLSYSLITRIDQHGAIIDSPPNGDRVYEGRIAPWIYMRMVQLPCPSMTFRRSCTDEVGLFDETLRATEDRDMWVRIALRYEVAFIPKITAYYRSSPASMTTDPDRMLRAQLQFIEKHYGSEGCGFMARRVALSQIYRQRAETMGLRKQRWAAVKSSMHAFGLYPPDLRNARTAGSLLLQWAGLR